MIKNKIYIIFLLLQMIFIFLNCYKMKNEFIFIYHLNYFNIEIILILGIKINLIYFLLE